MLLRFAGFELDPRRAELRTSGGEVVKLRPKNFEMLALLVADPGRIFSKQELMETVWPNVHVGDGSLFQCIGEIRIALGDEDRRIIKLVSGRGYRFDAEVTIEALGTPSQVPPAEAAVAPVAVPAKNWRPFGLSAPTALAAVADAAPTAAAVTARLADGLAKIENIRVMTPEAGSVSPQAASARAAQADF